MVKQPQFSCYVSAVSIFVIALCFDFNYTYLPLCLQINQKLTVVFIILHLRLICNIFKCLSMKAPLSCSIKLKYLCYFALMYKYYFDGVNWFDVML